MIASVDLLGAVVVGIGATLVTDLWARLLRHFSVKSLDFCLVGRWFCHMPSGVLAHGNIALAEKRSAECVVGWIAHYTIGAIFALALVGFTGGAWLYSPTFISAAVFGLGTAVFPLFVMQPALGLGFAALKTANPLLARTKTVLTHLVFGCGLYASGLAWNHLTNQI